MVTGWERYENNIKGIISTEHSGQEVQVSLQEKQYTNQVPSHVP